MKRYGIKWFELLIIILYPVAAYIVFTNRVVIASWWIPAIVMLLFCLIWPTIRSVLISSILLWIIAAPVWLYTETAQSAAHIRGNVPFILLMYIGIVLLPSLLLVSVKIKLWRTYTLKLSLIR